MLGNPVFYDPWMRLPLFLFVLSTLTQPAIRLGPEILVSGPLPYPQVETTVAAHPRDPKTLIGASISLVDRTKGTRVYTSADGGTTWTNAHLPGQIPDGADPQIAFTPRGTAIYLELPTVKNEGLASSPMHVWRSEDGGRTWEKTAELPGGWDHPQIAVDSTVLEHAGRIYITVIYGKTYTLGVFRSDDDGRTFTGPVPVIDGGETWNYFNQNPVVLSDGTLLIPFSSYPQDASFEGEVEAKLRMLASRDGGLTFSQDSPVASQTFPGPGDKATLFSIPSYAVDASAGPFRDRIYLTWVDFHSGRWGVYATWSADRGRTWREPKRIGNPGAESFQPMIAVNGEGTVGIVWFDTRAAKDGRAYEAWFTASVDGGETFLPEVKISVEPSSLDAPGNLEPIPSAALGSKGIYRIRFLNAQARYVSGGDYIGLAADAKSAFHPFWPDARSGRFQIFTRRITVDRSGETRPKPETVRADLRPEMEVLFDPAKYDPATQELRMPVRLKNRSQRPVYGPLQVRIVAFGSTVRNLNKEFTPTLLNATNGLPAEGAVFDFTAALGDSGVLEPGAVTSAMTWRLRLLDPKRTPDLQIEIFGEVEK
jgi:hypothetical protein